MISIIICTRNRSSILMECLKSVIHQGETLKKCEVLIIDNNSEDKTKETILQFEKSGFKYFLENEVGLSKSRNLGAEKANGELLCYIDDDAKLCSNFIKRILWITDNFNFDCFGGMYHAWYPYGKPKWIDDDFGTKKILRNSIGEIYTPDLSGGNFIIKKTVLESIGGFPTKFGMSGDKVAYAEETLVQKKLLERGYKLGFDPELAIDHAVLPHKFRLSWHIQKEFAQGRDNQRSVKIGVGELLKMSIITIGGILIKRIPFSMAKLILKKKYYWQNFILDVFSPVLYRTGEWYSYFFIND